MKTLTKSQHTITAVTRVAEFLRTTSTAKITDKVLTDRALRVLGYLSGVDFPLADETYQRCLIAVKGVNK